MNFNDLNAVLVTMQFGISTQQQQRAPIQKCEASFPIKKVHQFSLVLPFVCTLQKVQGLSLKKVAVPFELQRVKLM